VTIVSFFFSQQRVKRSLKPPCPFGNDLLEGLSEGNQLFQIYFARGTTAF